METFLLFSLAAAFLIATSNILVKHFLDLGIEDHVFVGAIYSLPFFIFFTALGLVQGSFVLEPTTIVLSGLAGAFYGVVLINYMKGMDSEEASRFIPLLSLSTVFIALLSFLLLGDTFTQVEYLGMGLAVIGAVMLSVEGIDQLKQLHSRRGTLFGILAALIIAFRDTIIEYLTQSLELWSILFWMGIGGFMFSLSILATRDFQKLSLSCILERRKMVSVGFLHALGYIFYATAISVGAAAKVSAVMRLNPLLVFLGTTSLAFLIPDFVDEETDWKKIVQKLAAAIVIIIGVFLLS
jgi:drug/metabolite transporter (DMT)-like permease